MPHSRVCLTVLALLIGFAAVPRSQQAPPPPPPPPPIGQANPPVPPATGTAFVAGQVVEIGSGQSVAGAAVTASMRQAAQAAPAPGGRAGGRAGGAFPPGVLADAQGRFYVANLPAGIVTLAVEAPGYVPSAPVFVELGDGERVLNVKVRIAKMGSVAGAIRDEVGDPVVGVTVAVFRRAIVNGRPGLQSAGTTRSDDQGAYRLGSLRPGEYLVCACGRDPNPFDPVLLTTLASEPVNLMSVAARALAHGADVVSIDDSVRTYPPTLHPNSQTIARATRVSVTAGEEKAGIDVLVPLVRATRVSGQAVGAKSAVQASAMRLIPAADAETGIDLTRIPPMLVQPDGRFDFASVPPGQYRLIVTHRETGGTGGSPTGQAMGLVGGRGLFPPGMPPPPPPPPPAPIRVDQRDGIPAPLWADELITVPDAGVSGLVVTLNQPASLRGRVQYVGAAPQPTEQMLTRASVSLQPLSVLSTGTMLQLAITAVAPDGTYRIAAVLPGKYILNPATLPPFRTLRSVTAGDIDITDLPLEVASRDLTDIVITMSDTTLASLTISAPGIAKAEETDAYQVLLFAADQKYWATPAAAARRMRTLPLSLKGAATATGLPAGDYYAALVTAQEAADWMDPARIEPLSRRAQRITLMDGEQRVLEVRK